MSTQQPKSTAPSRLRSPNYPNYSLRECIGFIRKFYSKYQGKEVFFDDAIKQMGHSPTSSTANRVIASLSGYGLIDVHGEGKEKFIKLTDLARDIIFENEGSSKWNELLKISAKNYQVIIDVIAKWGDNLPPEDTLKKLLEKDFNFSQIGAKYFASSLTDTLNYIDFQNTIINEKSTASEEDSDIIDQASNAASDNKSSSRQANLLLPGKNREIIIIVPDDLTEEEFSIISKWLDIQKFGLVKSNS